MSIQASHLQHVDLNFETVVLLDEAGATFQVQRSLVFDDQDRSLGMDTFCMVSDSGPSYYGGVEGWHFPRLIGPSYAAGDSTA